MGVLRRRGEALVKAAQNAVERRVAASHEDVVLQQSRTMVRTLTWILVGMSAASLAWLALAQTEEVVSAPGKLEPIGDVKTIQVPVGGVLDEVLVKEGQRVTKGQVLARLDNDATIDRALSVDKAIAAKQEQLRQPSRTCCGRPFKSRATSCIVWPPCAKTALRPSCSICSSAARCARCRASLPRPLPIGSGRWQFLSSLSSNCAANSPN